MILNHQQRSSHDDRSGLGFSLPQPSFTIGHSGYLNNSNGAKSGHYPPNHPLSNSKHLCSICGDRASGKHYGVYSCEGSFSHFRVSIWNRLSVCFVFQVARVFSSVQSGRIWLMPVAKIANVWLINVRGTVASTVAIKNAFKWAWNAKPSKKKDSATKKREKWIWMLQMVLNTSFFFI